MKQLRSWHLSALKVISEPMSALARTSERNCRTRTTNENCTANESWTRTKYRYVYTYNPRGLLVEKAGYREDSSSDGKNVYSYSPEGRKIEELIYSGDGRVQGRYEFDEHENFTSVEWYREDGSVRQKDNHRYEYVTKGNTLEQIYYPPQRQPGSAGFTFYAPLGGVPEKSAKIMTPLRYRTVFVRDDAGHVREESRYDVDGSLHEKKIFDQSGVLRRKEWGLGESSLTTTVYDETGREVELHTFAKQGFLSPRAVNDRTLFSYDGHGNL